MAKIAQVSAKYIIHASIFIEGMVDRPDVIGAIFGQTEGLLGADLELREIQKSGRIGRIEVNVQSKGGKTQGEIIIPSSLDKAETSIVAAAIEIIERIGPCNAKVEVKKIEDIRISKRESVIKRAKNLLKDLMDKSMPDSQELSDEVAHSVRMMEIQTYGKEKLSCGPGVEESDEVIVVEGRADVLALLKHGFKNAIAINGTSVPETIIKLGKEKTLTAFVDGDRGGKLIIQELLSTTELDYVTKAPDGKEVEELTKKEIHKSLRSKITAEQSKLEMFGPEGPDKGSNGSNNRSNSNKRSSNQRNNNNHSTGNGNNNFSKPKDATDKEKEKFLEMVEGLVGSRGANILDDKLDILGKVPVSELQSTIKSLGSGMYAVVFDGAADKDLVVASEKAGISYLVCMDSKVKSSNKVFIYTSKDL
jgi:5S rRNA maturation endonuclease (ribonuclease M5)